MARAMAFMYASAASLGLIAVIPPNDPRVEELGVVATALAGFAVVALLVAAFDRLPVWAFQCLVAVGVALVTLAIYFDGRAASTYALFYIWVTIFVFYFLTWAQAAGFMLLSGGAYGVVLLVHDSLASFDRWLVAFGTLLLLGALIGLLRRRMQGLIVRLADAASTDALTEALNRRGFDTAFDVELERARRGDRVLSLLIADLDHFKHVNDSLGHSRGDEVLTRTARVLEANRRRIDTVARIGGEEFAILMPEADAGAALVLAERLRDAVRQDVSDDDVAITISVGVASFPVHGENQDELLHSADHALYAAKELGRDRSVVYSAEVDDILTGSASWRLSQGEGQLATVLGLAEALDTRETSKRGHSQLVGHYAESLARELGLRSDRVERVRLAGVLHDIGKVGVPDSVLQKSGPLTAGEWQEVRQHPAIGARLLEGSELEDIRAWVFMHHERPDGRGFPSGLASEQVPLEAKILAVADAYEAMVSDRPYRAALPEETAREELQREAGAGFDERVVHALIAVLDREGRSLVHT